MATCVIILITIFSSIEINIIFLCIEPMCMDSIRIINVMSRKLLIVYIYPGRCNLLCGFTSAHIIYIWSSIKCYESKWKGGCTG